MATRGTIEADVVRKEVYRWFLPAGLPHLSHSGVPVIILEGLSGTFWPSKSYGILSGGRCNLTEGISCVFPALRHRFFCTHKEVIVPILALLWTS